MPKERFAMAILFLAIPLMALTTIRCDCQSTQHACNSATECEEFEWPKDCEGEWACENNLCVAVCNQCTAPADCEGETWDNPACTAAEGHWECIEGECVSLCDDQCEVAADCEGETWDNQECVEADGHWECDQGQCNAVCDPDCYQDNDCDLNPWPGTAECSEQDGHWECWDGTCEPVCESPECTDAQDCIVQMWPEDAGCTWAQGHWECNDGSCEAVCDSNCENLYDCVEHTWEEVCQGHWACTDGWCTETCDPVGCSDGNCDNDAGETVASCPDDCLTVCALPSDCVEEAWELPCQGRFDCVEEACVGVCDYALCGDEACDPDSGENQASCLVDCFDECETDRDCLSLEWTDVCVGHFNCYNGDCDEICEDFLCGDGDCKPEEGENGFNCPEDCGAGGCTLPTDCFAYTWGDVCEGHWDCTQNGACEEVCESDTCGDANCDVLGGESPENCLADCDGYDCEIDPDCDLLSLPGGCTGPFLCLSRVCWPNCE